MGCFCLIFFKILVNDNSNVMCVSQIIMIKLTAAMSCELFVLINAYVG